MNSSEIRQGSLLQLQAYSSIKGFRKLWVDLKRGSAAGSLDLRLRAEPHFRSGSTVAQATWRGKGEGGQQDVSSRWAPALGCLRVSCCVTFVSTKLRGCCLAEFRLLHHLPSPSQGKLGPELPQVLLQPGALKRGALRALRPS